MWCHQGGSDGSDREQILDIVMSTVYQYLSVETLNSIPQIHTEDNA